MIEAIKEWLTIWLFITMVGVGLLLVAALMPILAVHRIAVALTDWWYTEH
tara:strand:- start:45 stop:194 length:150 start_codon:yes stop_codon:yes gene_type:complete